MAAEEKPPVKSSTSIVPCFLFVEVSYPTALTLTIIQTLSSCIRMFYELLMGSQPII